MKPNIKFALIVFCIPLTMFFGCKKKDNTQSAQFWLHLHTNIDTSEVVIGATYANPTDSTLPHTHFRNMTIDSAGYLITNMRLVSTTNDTLLIAGSNVALASGFTNSSINAVADSEQYAVATIKPGTYKSITFDVTNWYVYGHVDTSANGNGTPTVAYAFIEGATVTVRMPDHALYFKGAYDSTEFVFTANGTTFIHMIADYSKLLRGIDMRTFQTDVNNGTILQQFANNISSTFRYEE